MTIHRYPPTALIGDAWRAAAGLTLTAGPALALPVGSPALYVLVPLGLLFLAFAVRTWRRRVTRVEIDAAEISIFRPGRVSLSWSGLGGLSLNYYSTKFDRSGGWMQLTLKGTGPAGRRIIRIDSGLEGFAEIARRAAAAANGLELSAATVANFGALGIAVEQGLPPPVRDGAAAGGGVQGVR